LEKAESFVAGMDFEEFLEDEKTRYSLICALEIVGEAAKKVPTAVRQRNSQVPWKDMAGMRDRLIHGYFGVGQRNCVEDCQRVRSTDSI